MESETMSTSVTSSDMSYVFVCIFVDLHIQVRWHAQSPKDIAARYYQVLKKTQEERITYAGTLARRHKMMALRLYDVK